MLINGSLEINLLISNYILYIFTNYKYKNDPYWVKIAVIQDIHAFQYASYKLRNNANFIFELFNSLIIGEFHLKIFKMDLLKYISYKLKNDFIFIKSLENKYNISLFHYVSNKLKKNINYLLHTLSIDGFNLQSIKLHELSISQDRIHELIYVALNNHGCALQYVPYYYL